MKLSLGQKLAVMYPGSDPFADYIVEDNGNGAVLKTWNLNTPKPTEIEINAYDFLPYYKEISLKRVKQASEKKRLKYVTLAAGKDAEYTFKAQEAVQFDIDGTVGPFMQGRINATGETAASIAAEWNGKSQAWKSIGAAIAGLEDKANQQINSETIASQCEVIANNIILEIESI